MTVTHSRPAAAPPASGAWRPGDPLGGRILVDVGDLPLESGRVLPSVTLAYETWGRLAPDGSNAVLVLHALTGDSHVIGPAGPGHPTPGWWQSLVGPGRPIDTDRWCVIAPNVLGGCQGSTGPSSAAPDGRPWGSRFPRVTVRDQVAAEDRLRRHLGIDRWALVIGGSMGGMRALEWAVSLPGAVDRLAAVATGAAASADQIAWSCAQAAAIRACGGFAGGDYYDLPAGQGPHRGLGVARRIAHTTYRTAEELEERFGNRPQDEPASQGPSPDGASPDGAPSAFMVGSYLDHHAEKLARRFDANSYLVLSDAMDTHDVGRGRGGIEAALGRVTARTLAVGIRTDRLFPLAMSARTARGIPGARLRVIDSPLGHDGFLVECPQLAEWLRDLLRG